MKIRLGRYIGPTALIFTLLVSGACSREGVGQGIVVKVIDESKSSNPFGAVKTERRYGAGIDVFLIPGDTPLNRLTLVSSQWISQKTNKEGTATFPDVEGIFHIAADANGDNIIDASLTGVPSGSRKTITITKYGEGNGASTLEANCGDDVYHPHDKARVTVAGFLEAEGPVTLELWHDVSEGREKLFETPAQTFSGAVSFSVDIVINPAYPLTKNSTFDDYLVLPYVQGKYFTGCRFSVREVTSSTVIDDMSILINNGDIEVDTRNVNVTAQASGAQSMGFSEDPLVDPATLTRFKYGGKFGLQLSDGDGLKVVFAWFFDVDGNFAGPVTDSITLNTHPPIGPWQYLTHVIMNPPGMHDFVYGDAGAVRGGYFVTAYRSPYLDANQVLSQVQAAADGSFGPMSIGDGSAGNVVKPQDFVYLTSTDSFSRESTAVSAYNDSTPPDLRPEDIYGSWLSGRPSGRTGDELTTSYFRPSGYAPSADAAGGTVNFVQFGGASSVTMTVITPDQFSATFTVPVGMNVDRDDLHVIMRIRDAAYNMSATVASSNNFSVDTIPPNPVTLAFLWGGNQGMYSRWNDPNLDTFTYLWTHTNEVGTVKSGSLNVLDYCRSLGYITTPCLNYWVRTTGGAIPFDPGDDGMGAVPFYVANCHWYTMRVRAVDDAGNISGYSNAISDRVILPPPRFNAWGGLSTAGDGTLVYSFFPVNHGASYEIHVDLDSGAPYNYVTTGFTSPVVKPYPGEYKITIGRINGLPLRETFYLNARSVDDANSSCKSDFAREMTASTDLRIESFSDGVVAEETMGGALAKVNDFDGDGKIDLLVGAPTPRYVAVVSAATGARISTFGAFRSPDAYDIPGKPLASADIDNDGKDEFIVGSPLDSAGGMFLSGVVRIYDDNATLLRTIDGDSIGRHFGFTIENLGDIDLDGRDDIAIGGFGCANADCGFDYGNVLASQGPGKVVIYSGANLASVDPLVPLQVHVGANVGDYFGVAIAGGKDLDGDGINDYAIGSPGTRYVVPDAQIRIYSGATRSEIYSYQFDPNAYGIIDTLYAASLALVSDINYDGRADIVSGNMGLTVAGSVSMIVYYPFYGLYLRWQQSGSDVLGGPGFGAVVATGGDINGDGKPDIVVGAPNGLQNFFYGPGAAFVLDGRSGRYLYELRGAAADGVVGYSALIPGNVNAGLRDEWVVGAPGSAFGGYQSGRLYILTTDP